MTRILWTCWLVLTLAGATTLFVALPGDSTASSLSTVFLPGKTTHGHHQIEMKCAVCHLPDGGVTDQSCIDCHAAELKDARDTHPASKFNDPMKGPLLLKIDAQNCLSCHVEHESEQTHPMGVTVPEDYCFHCHEDVAKDRPSHEGLAFNSCANAGCHNYHDNKALYENFLHKHIGEANVLPTAATPVRRFQQWLAEAKTAPEQLTVSDADAPTQWSDDQLAAAWAASPHATAGVNCTGCHQSSELSESNATDDEAWLAVPDHQSCGRCHDAEVGGFLDGRHGMRIKAELSPMTPDLARLPMHGDAHGQLDCSACHDPHQPDLAFAAYRACVSCHDDAHTNSYASSSHFALWQDEHNGLAAAGTGVSCATCHMPRDEDGRVQHNQNHNLRPNEKMARTVCMNCHGLQFTLNALADPELKNNCYATAPNVSVESLNMVDEWFESRKRR